jgi:hypothetical protein
MAIVHYHPGTNASYVCSFLPLFECRYFCRREEEMGSNIMPEAIQAVEASQ